MECVAVVAGTANGAIFLLVLLAAALQLCMLSSDGAAGRSGRCCCNCCDLSGQEGMKRIAVSVAEVV
jgi:hypothetical protein